MQQFASLIIFVSTFLSVSQASTFCEPPRTNVWAKVSKFTIAENGQVFCYAKEQFAPAHYLVQDCSMLNDGDIVSGMVVTYWTHKDENGKPVCDYQEFISR